MFIGYYMDDSNWVEIVKIDAKDTVEAKNKLEDYISKVGNIVIKSYGIDPIESLEQI